MDKSYIVLQAYGSESILQECAFALLTLTRQHTADQLAELEIWIYTDQPQYFSRFRNCPLHLHFREMNTALIKQWRGAIDFVHRVKIELLLDFAAQHAGRVLYLDTDVYIAQPLTKVFEDIAEGNLYMHIMEGLVHQSENVMLQKMSKFLRANDPVKVGNERITIPPHTAMWNAGVLGFHTRDIALLRQVLKFTDEVYTQFRKHVVEQFAFSFYFQHAAPLKTAHTRIFHYWNLKEMRSVIASFFRYFKDKSWDELAYYSVLIQLPEPMQQKVNFLQNRTPIEKFRKKGWQPQEPHWDLLVQQL